MSFAAFMLERRLLEIGDSSSGEVSTRTFQMGGCLIKAKDLKEFLWAAPMENRVMCKLCYVILSKLVNNVSFTHILRNVRCTRISYLKYSSKIVKF